MIVTVESVLKIYKLVLTQQLTYDEADRWAWDKMQLMDDRKLEFEPEDKEDLIWNLIDYLYGIDISIVEDRNKPAKSDLDIIDFLKANGVYDKLQSI